MDKITALLAFLTTLSLATERITETVKGLPLLSRWLAVEKAPDSTPEELRKASMHILAIGIGTWLACMVKGQIGTVIGMQQVDFWLCLLFGAMASGGSGLWNSLLDIAREMNRQKQVITETLKSNPTVAATAASRNP
jgi:hypothetical protein